MGFVKFPIVSDGSPDGQIATMSQTNPPAGTTFNEEDIKKPTTNLPHKWAHPAYKLVKNRMTDAKALIIRRRSAAERPHGGGGAGSRYFELSSGA